MKVDYLSDVHVNHHIILDGDETLEDGTKKWTKELLNNGITKDNVRGEILIVAGDISDYNDQAIWFLEAASELYERVLFVTGNHDKYIITKEQVKKYGGYKKKEESLFEEASKIKGVVPLNKDVVEYKGYVIAGDCLWYYPDNEEDWLTYYMFSDFKYVVNYMKDGLKVPPVSTLKTLYRNSEEWFNSLLGVDIDIFVSHIPPTLSPYSTFERSSLFEFPANFMPSKHWICGHQHAQGDFKYKGTNVYMNPIGYPRENNEHKLKSFIV